VSSKKEPGKILNDRSEISQHLFIDYATQHFQVLLCVCVCRVVSVTGI
jgi:hypothetical protein